MTESLTNSVRVMITCTVRQSVSPAASTAATWGSRSTKASACETTMLAAAGDRFIAAAISALVR